MLVTHPVHSIRLTGAMYDVPPSYALSRRGTRPDRSRSGFWVPHKCVLLQLCNTRLLLKGHFSMSRIPARGAVVASGTASVVLALCVVAGLATESSTGAVAATGSTTDTSQAVHDDTVANAVNSSTDLLTVSGSHEGVSFGVTPSVMQQLDSAMHLGMVGSALVGAAAAAQASNDAVFGTTASYAPIPAGAQPPAPGPLKVQSRSSTLAAVSGSPREIARALAAERGWSGDQWSCLSNLWQRESRFQPTIRNSRSGAYGIPQALPASKMASAGTDWRVNPVTQVQWGLGYIAQRYGSPCDAWSYWKRHLSY
jgi:hypothetical protein